MHASTLIVLLISAMGALGAVAAPRCGSITHAGVTLETCQKKSYEGSTIKEYPGAKDVRDCARMCSETAGCHRAVFDRKFNWCLIKGPDSQGEKLPSEEYDIATVTWETPDGKEINGCLAGGSVRYTVGHKVFAACKNADYQQDSVDIRGGIESGEDCAKFCASETNCKHAVWVAEYKACHVKQKRTPPKVFRRGMIRMSY